MLRLARLEANAPGRVMARGEVSLSPDGQYRLTLRAEQQARTGERTFSGSSCQSVTDAAILTLTLMLNPEADVSQAPRTTPPGSEPAEVPNVLAPPAATVAPPTPAAVRSPGEPGEPGDREWPWQSSALATVGLRGGVLPEPAPELLLGAGVAKGPLAVRATLSAVPPQTASAAAGEGRGKLWAMSGRLLAGWEWLAQPITLEGALGAEFTRVGGEGRGVSEPAHGSIYWVSAVAGLIAGYGWSPRFSLTGDLIAIRPLARPRFFVDSESAGELEVHRPQVIGIAGHWGVCWRW